MNEKARQRLNPVGLFLCLVFFPGLVVEKELGLQCLRAALSAFEAADAAVIIGLLVGLDTIGAQGSATSALSTLMLLQVHGDQREAVEKAEDCPQRAENTAPRAYGDKDGDKKGQYNRDFDGVGPGDGIAADGRGDDIGQGFFDTAGRTYPTDKQRVAFAEEIRNGQHRPQQDDIAEIAHPLRNFEPWGGDFGGQVLQQAKWTDPAADNRPKEGADSKQQADGNKRKQVQGRKLGDDADGAGEGRQRAGVTMKDGGTDGMHPEIERVQPDQEKQRLDGGSPRDEFRDDFLYGGLFGCGHHGLLYLPQVGQDWGASPV